MWSATLMAITSGETTYLIILVAVLAVSFWAASRVVLQAGYSLPWLALPLAAVILTIVCYSVLLYDLHGFSFGVTPNVFDVMNVGLAWRLDEVAIVLNWVFFLFIAFSGSLAPRSPRRPKGPIPSRLAPSEASGEAPRATLASTTQTATTGDRSAAPATAPASSTGPKIKNCVWCAEALPGSRALFHDCGPKDRPAVYCSRCASALPAGSGECPACLAVQ